MPSKKKFIDKKNAVTFYLGHRSQRDPLIADENAPQRVLVPMDQMPSAYASNPSTSKSSKVDALKRKEEQLEYGIYFDDDYDYLQHLKDSKEVSNIEWDLCERVRAPVPKSDKATSETKDIKLKLPSSVFQSEYEENVGLLNKAAPAHGFRPDLDSDVLAALDDDFDFNDPNNCLEDNFIDLANGGDNMPSTSSQLQPEDMEGLFSSDEDNEGTCSEEDDEVGSLDEGPQYTFAGEETRSHFTNYSMSSSVVRRNDQLTLIDDRFEKMFEDYEDTEIGALDLDEIEGYLDVESDMLMKCAEEFEEQDDEEAIHEKVRKLALKQEELSDNDDTLTDSDEDTKEKEKWDCASIISTYSTTKNRPKLIKEASQRNKIRVSSKTGMPVGVLGKGLTKSNLKDLDSAYEEEHGLATKSLISTVSRRDKNETPEQRLQRKKLLKEIRRERIIERKANTDAFKEEKKRQEKVRLNVKANLQGLKL